MKGKRRTVYLILWGGLILLLLILVFVVGSPGPKTESIQEAMRDAVLHEHNKVRFLGMEVNPAVISDYVVTGILLLAALLIRLLVIPKFRKIPGKFQLLLETWVGFFTDLAKNNSPHKNKLLGGYIFFAGSYIFLGTLFELLGMQWITIHGASISLPAPLSDINTCIAMGCLSFFFILLGGLSNNGVKGLLGALKEFSLPISMSFRLFGALLSGLLVTELVYYSLSLSFVLPVVVGILFTLMHAIIQTYVLTMLTSTFYGEVSE